MRFADDECLARLAVHGHGVMCTLHAERGPDANPVVYVSDGDGYIGVAIDRVKPKSTTRLQRMINLEADPRAQLLIDHWVADDWSQLWWVRAELRWESDAPAERLDDLATRLSEQFPQYADKPFAQVCALRIVSLAGWAATE